MSRLDLDTLLSLRSLEELRVACSSIGVDGDEVVLLKKAQEDFYEGALERARGVTGAPSCFEPERVCREGVEYEVYGVIHGMFGGDDKEYLRFVSEPISSAAFVVFENGLNYFYKHGASRVIPDFVVLGAPGSLAMGLYVGWSFPVRLWELVSEGLKLSKGRGAESGFLFDTRYYALDGELRRGVEPQPPLPSRLQIELEMREWNNSPFLARLKDPFALVPRSLFMAGFAVGVSMAHPERPVKLVVGDLHTMEVVRFLEDPSQDHPLFRLGMRYGKAKGLSSVIRFLAVKLAHLGFAGLGGCVILVPVLMLIFWVLNRLMLG